MQLQYLEYFLQVAKTGSISKAADILFLKQSNLSNCIKILEQDFGTELFIRTSKGVILTPNGEKVFHWAQNVIHTQKELILDFSQQHSNITSLKGNINFYMISSINSIFYPTLCAKLVSALPSVNFNFEESNIQNIFQKVNSSATNIGLTVLNETMQKNIADNTNLSFISLKTCKLVAYCSNESPFKKYHSISIKTLLKLPLIDYKIGGEQISPVTELCAEYGTPNFVLQTSNINTFYTLLNEGKYLSIGVDTLSGMKNFSIIPTRESFNLTMGILVQPGYLQSPIMNAVTQTIINIQSKKI